MVNTTVELIALYASTSSSLLAFCFSHLIIAVLLLGCRGCTSDIDGRGDCATETETRHSIQFHREMNSGGHEDLAVGDRGSTSSNADSLAVAGATQQRKGETNSGGEGESDFRAGTLQDRCSDEDEEDDELMIRAEEFIQRMNRAWRNENVRAC